MRLICFWCFLLAAVVRAQNDGYYAKQTFKALPKVEIKFALPVPAPHDNCDCNTDWGNNKPCKQKKQDGSSWDSPRFSKTEVTKENLNLLEQNYQQRELFSPARNDVASQSTTVPEPWRHPAPVNNGWRDPHSGPGSIIPKSDLWRQSYGLSKEQQAAIIHHKQSLSSDGAFRFEYASDNGLAAGEQIEPDGSRVGAYQYKDPSGQMVKLKYRAGKDGFQILEGSHLPKSPEPVVPVKADNYNVQAYNQQRNQYDTQQQYHQQKPVGQVQTWGHNQGSEDTQRPTDNHYFINNWRPQPGQDDGQYRENEVDLNKPHNFGEGYAFAFKG